MILDILGEGLLAAVRGSHVEIANHVEAVVEWLREASRPPPGVRLVAPDGSVFTGFVVVEKNAAVVLLAVKHPSGVAERPPLVAPPPSHRGVYGLDRFDPESPMWDRDPMLHHR